MNFAHTPGPWHVQANESTPLLFAGEKHFVCAPRNNFRLAELTNYNGHEREANGRLMSCAPEMLEALIEARDREHNPFEREQSVAYVRLAELIAKATGVEMPVRKLVVTTRALNTRALAAAQAFGKGLDPVALEQANAA